MTKTFLTTIAALALTGSLAIANEHNHSAASHLEQIVTEAKKTQLEAQEIASLLKSKNVDFARVNTKVDLLEKHVVVVRNLISEVESTHSNLTESQKSEFQRMKTAAEVVNIFVDNKKAILAGADVSKQRNLLRAKAQGIAQRAGVVQQSAIRFRS